MILPRPRGILMTADTVGGVWRYSIELSRELTAQGAEVVLATMGRPLSDDQWVEAKAVDGLKVEESDYRLEWMADCDRDLERAGRWLLDLERRHRPDIVHLNQYSHGSLPWRAPVVMTAHSCVLSWWRAVKGCDAPAEWSAYAGRVSRGLQAADLVTAPTTSFLREVSMLHGPFRRACVVLNGRSAGGLRPAEAKQPFIFAAGRVWDEAKNIAVLGQSAGGVRWPIVVAGEDGGPDGSRRQCAGVEAVGRLPSEEMAEIMGRAAVFASPALYEPFGLAVLEAALSGCALVLSDIATFRELWDGVAVFVRPNDPGAWAEALDRMAADEGRRSDLGRAARHRALGYSAERMAAETLAAYTSLAPRPAAFAV